MRESLRKTAGKMNITGMSTATGSGSGVYVS